MKIRATMTLVVVYDDGGDENFDPDGCLRHVVKHAAENGLLTSDDSPATVDTYGLHIATEEH